MGPATPSSPFAAILRRSKFATYDPSIAQVYASFGGHLHRGNWGLKRPLPIRRREAYVTVQSVDSKQEQTEWKRADSEARLMKMWDVVGITPQLQEDGPWEAKLGPTAVVWKADSEFAGSGEEGRSYDITSRDSLHGPSSSAVPNILAMSDKEFDRYLEQLRKARPEFAVFLKEISTRKAEQSARILPGGTAQETPEFTSFWDTSFTPVKDHKPFLESRAHQSYNSTGSRVIEQQPHTYAGLTYGKSSPLQSWLLNKPQPAHMISVEGPDSQVASFAGMLSRVQSKQSSSQSISFKRLATDGNRNPQEGINMFRLSAAILSAPPTIVGPRAQGLDKASLSTTVAVDNGKDMSRSNAHPPGSREYIAYNTTTVMLSDSMLPRENDKPNLKQPKRGSNLVEVFQNRAIEGKRTGKQEMNSKMVLDTLQGILSASRKSSNSGDKQQ